MIPHLPVEPFSWTTARGSGFNYSETPVVTCLRSRFLERDSEHFGGQVLADVPQQ
jgi:hypothetical protein